MRVLTKTLNAIMQAGINGLFFKNKDFNLYFMDDYLTIKRPTLLFHSGFHKTYGSRYVNSHSRKEG